MTKYLCRISLLIAFAVSNASQTYAFTPPNQAAFSGAASTSSRSSPSAALGMQTKQPPAVPDSPSKYSYGEESRKFRRTVYTHDDWVKHRSSDRFFRNLRSITQSGIYENISKEVIATTSVAAALCFWNCIFGDYQDFSGVSQAGLMKDSLISIAFSGRHRN